MFEHEGHAVGATSRARGLRRRMTWTEQRLWKELRKLDANFRRQAPIGRYFADFASHVRRLVIEVDGGVHERLADVALRDAERQRWLEGEGYRVLRLTDNQVRQDVHGCIEAIALLLDGGGLGGGERAESARLAQIGPGARSNSLSKVGASTTIPGPSSIEEEGGEPFPAISGKGE